MTMLRVTVKYPSGIEYSLAGQGIDLAGVAVTVTGTGASTVSVGFKGRHVDASRGPVSEREYASVHLSSEEAQALAGALMAIAKGGVARVEVQF